MNSRQAASLTFLGFTALMTMQGTIPSGFAQDVIGIYWDDEYTERSAAVPIPNQTLEGHLVIEDPSVGGGIIAWECEVFLDGPAYFVNWAPNGQAFNLEAPPRFTVGLSEPLPYAATTALASFQILVTEVEPVRLGLSPLTGIWPERPMSYRAADQSHDSIPLTADDYWGFVAWVDEKAPLFVAEPDTLDIGHVAIGTSKGDIVTVTNAGGGILWVEPRLDCPDSLWELYSYPRTYPIEAGGSQSIGVRFHANVFGESRCTMNFGPRFPSIPLVATAGEPRYDWEITPPDHLEIAVGSSKWAYIRMENTGDLPLDLDVQLREDTEHFEIVRGKGQLTLDLRHEHLVIVSAKSWSPGEFLAEVDFGPGLPKVPVTASVAYLDSISFSVNKEFLDYGFIAQDSTRTLGVRVSNTDFVPFAVVPVIEPAGSAFSVPDEGVAQPVEYRRPVNLYIDFQPTHEGLHEAVLHLGEGLPSIPLSGGGATTGIHCGVQPDTTDFGTVEVGDWNYRTLVVTNQGTQTLQLTPQTTSPGFYVITNTRTLDTGETALIEYSFLPDRVGDFVGVIDLGSEACSDIVLLGTAVEIGTPATLPSPSALVNSRRVILDWTPNFPAAEGYHVWRRGQTDPSVRLTHEPLAPLESLHFRDEPDPSLGTTLHYCYAAIVSGEEFARSRETTVILPDLPTIHSQILGTAPNPFNPEVSIHFAVGQVGPVKIGVYDMTGRLLKTLVNGQHDSGNLKVRWDGKDRTGHPLPSGSYIIRLETVDRIDSKKVTMLK